MTSQEKAAGVVATPATAHSKARTRKFPSFQRFAKASIVAAALRGWLPWPIAQWLIQRGGLDHV